MKKERNCTNFDNRMPMFGSPALPTHKVAERVEVFLRIPSFSLLASWGKFFGILLGPATTFFLNSAFPRLSWLPPFAVGLERRRGFNGASVIFHKLYMVRGDFGAIWRVFSAKLALRAAFFSKQDSAASAASNRRPCRPS